MDGFTKEVLERLPLADGVLSLLSWVFESDFFGGVFDQFRGRSYESEITFPAMVSLVQDALWEHQGNAHQAIIQTQERDELEVSMQAVYGKLRRIPIGLSLGFLALSLDYS